jgi:hypothetical protein
MAAEQSMICGMIWTKATRAPAALQVDSLPSNLRQTIGFKELVSAPWPRDLKTDASTLTASKKLYKMRKMLFLLPYFLPGKARILLAHATPRKTLNLFRQVHGELCYTLLEESVDTMKAYINKEPASAPTQPRHKSQTTTKNWCFLRSCEIPRTISSWILVFFSNTQNRWFFEKY